MSTVNTVTGPMDTSEMGFTLTHEHVATNAAGLRHTYPELIDRAGIFEQSIAAMKLAYEEGVRTIIDVSTFDLGRDIGMIQEVSQASGVQIIAATGNHLSVPRPFAELSPDDIAPLFVRELEDGIEDTGVKAGIITVASDRGRMPRPQDVVLRAAARGGFRSFSAITTSARASPWAKGRACPAVRPPCVLATTVTLSARSVTRRGLIA